MRNKPTGTDLILVARKALVDEIIGQLPEDKKNIARQIARAMNIASREIDAGDWPLKNSLTRIVEIFGKEAEDDMEFALKTPGAIERVLKDFTATLSRRIREGEFDQESESRQQVQAHLLAFVLDKLQEDDPKYLESEGFA